MTTRAIIIGAGRGERLMPTTADAPKCFAEVGGRRILDWTVEALPSAGVEQIAFIGGYRIEAVQAGSIVAASEPVDSGSGSSGEEKGGSRKYTKRGRAARRTATDTQNSLLFANARAPKFAQALACRHPLPASRLLDQ